MNYIFTFGIAIILTCLACKSNSGSSDGFSNENENNSKVDSVPFDSLLFDYEREDRVIWQKPGLVMDLLGDISQKTIADLGAGSGYFAFRLLESAEKVIALDIDPRAIEYMDSIQSTLPEALASKFETRLVTPENAFLSDAEVNIILMVNTYMYITDRVNYFNRIKSSLQNGSKLLIIDFKKKELPMGPPSIEKLDQSIVEQELRQAGYQIELSDDRSLEYQYIIIARK